MADYLCKKCDYNNHGWCKIHQRQKLMEITACDDLTIDGDKQFTTDKKGDINPRYIDNLFYDDNESDTPPWEEPGNACEAITESVVSTVRKEDTDWNAKFKYHIERAEAFLSEGSRPHPISCAKVHALLANAIANWVKKV